jgi:hypothetical protein
MFQSYDHLQVAIELNKKLNNYSNSVALDGIPEPDLVHATGCKQPSLRLMQ